MYVVDVIYEYFIGIKSRCFHSSVNKICFCDSMLLILLSSFLFSFFAFVVFFLIFSSYSIFVLSYFILLLHFFFAPFEAHVPDACCCLCETLHFTYSGPETVNVRQLYVWCWKRICLVRLSISLDIKYGITVADGYYSLDSKLSCRDLFWATIKMWVIIAKWIFNAVIGAENKLAGIRSTN